jgi:hypothetical protein
MWIGTGNRTAIRTRVAFLIVQRIVYSSDLQQIVRRFEWEIVHVYKAPKHVLKHVQVIAVAKAMVFPHLVTVDAPEIAVDGLL